MGQKVHPTIFRILNGKSWKSTWFANKHQYAKLLHEDFIIRKLLKSRLKDAGIADIIIERLADQIVVKLFTSKPGVVIGRDGSEIEALKKLLQTKLQTRGIEIKVEEVRKPEISATLIGDNIARQIERRIPYRRAVKQAIDKAMEMGALGCKIKTSGRLNGVEIARREKFSKGSIPLQTIRSDVDYGYEVACTAYGTIGIKVWVYTGENKLSQISISNQNTEQQS